MTRRFNWWWPNTGVGSFLFAAWLLLAMGASWYIAGMFGGVVNLVVWYLVITLVRAVCLAGIGAHRRPSKVSAPIIDPFGTQLVMLNVVTTAAAPRTAARKANDPEKIHWAGAIVVLLCIFVGIPMTVAACSAAFTTDGGSSVFAE